MSEQSKGVEMGSPRERAVAYLTVRQGELSSKLMKGEKKVKTGTFLPIPKVERTAPLVESVTAFEKLVDGMQAKGYEGAQKVLEGLRPVAYDGIRFLQWSARAADFLLTAGLFIAPRAMADNLPLLNRLPRPGTTGGGTTEFFLRNWWTSKLTVLGMNRFRPAEFAVAKVTQGAMKLGEICAPITNAILQGGERVQPGQDATRVDQVMHAQADATKQ